MLAPEGRWVVAASVSLAGAVQIGAGPRAAALPWGLAAGLAWVYRERRARVPARPLGVVSPVDGRVLAVRPCEDPWLQREASRIGLRTRWPGIGPLRSPVEGRVEDYRFAADPYKGEAFCGAGRRMAESHALWLRTDEGDDVVLVISSFTRLLRLTTRLHVGARLGQGQRFGFLHFASRVDLLLPADARVEVQPRRRVRAGEAVLAELVHREPTHATASPGEVPG